MKITVSAELDDGTEIKRICEVESSGNPLFWSRGVQRGVDHVTESIRRMIESEYGNSDHEGVHVVRAG